MPSQDSSSEVFDADDVKMQSQSPDTHDDNDNSAQDKESQSISAKCDLPKDTSENLQGKPENNYLDTGTICSLLVENKPGLPKFQVG